MLFRDAQRTATLGLRLGRLQAMTNAVVDELQAIAARAAAVPPGTGSLANLVGPPAGGDGRGGGGDGAGDGDPAVLFDRPIVDPAAMTVTWRGGSCRLRNRVVFHLFARLARRPNDLVPYERLLRDAWDGQYRTDEAIRNAVHRMKACLRRAGMPALAAAVRSGGRRCGLMLDDAAADAAGAADANASDAGTDAQRPPRQI